MSIWLIMPLSKRKSMMITKMMKDSDFPSSNYVVGEYKSWISDAELFEKKDISLFDLGFDKNEISVSKDYDKRVTVVTERILVKDLLEFINNISKENEILYKKLKEQSSGYYSIAPIYSESSVKSNNLPKNIHINKEIDINTDENLNKIELLDIS
jgi:predicted nuclease of predicted toxin-antitoxin system